MTCYHIMRKIGNVDMLNTAGGTQFSIVFVLKFPPALILLAAFRLFDDNRIRLARRCAFDSSYSMHSYAQIPHWPVICGEQQTLNGELIGILNHRPITAWLKLRRLNNFRGIRVFCSQNSLKIAYLTASSTFQSPENRRSKLRGKKLGGHSSPWGLGNRGIFVSCPSALKLQDWSKIQYDLDMTRMDTKNAPLPALYRGVLCKTSPWNLEPTQDPHCLSLNLN
jgi:hypothetical protein